MSRGMEESAQMDGMIRILRDERYEVNKMNGGVYVDNLGGGSAFEESGFRMLHGGGGYEYDGKAVDHRDVMNW
jgi:hypothetical protein